MLVSCLVATQPISGLISLQGIVRLEPLHLFSNFFFDAYLPGDLGNLAIVSLNLLNLILLYYETFPLVTHWVQSFLISLHEPFLYNSSSLSPKHSLGSVGVPSAVDDLTGSRWYPAKFSLLKNSSYQAKWDIFQVPSYVAFKSEGPN